MYGSAVAPSLELSIHNDCGAVVANVEHPDAAA